MFATSRFCIALMAETVSRHNSTKSRSGRSANPPAHRACAASAAIVILGTLHLFTIGSWDRIVNKRVGTTTSRVHAAILTTAPRRISTEQTAAQAVTISRDAGTSTPMRLAKLVSAIEAKDSRVVHSVAVKQATTTSAATPAGSLDRDPVFRHTLLIGTWRQHYHG